MKSLVPVLGTALSFILLAMLACLGCKSNERSGEHDSSARALPIDPEVIQMRLDNGFTYLLKPAKNDGSVIELALVVKVGSAAEGDQERGFAHFVEHVAFEQSFGDLERENPARRQGIEGRPDANATTTRASTVYRMLVHNAEAETLARALDIMKNLASSVRFDASALERQRGIILAEQRLRDNPVGAASSWHLFQGSSYADREPGGLEGLVVAANFLQLEAFYRRWYQPQSLAIIATGQFERVKLSQMIEERFAGLRSSDGTPVPAYEAPVGPAREFLIRDAASFGLKQSSIELLSKLPPAALEREGDFSRQLVDQCLASLLDARLERLWLQPLSEWAERPSVDVGSETTEGRFQAFRIRIVPKSGQLVAATAALLTELERVNQHGFTEKELTRARAEVSRTLAIQATLQKEVERLTRVLLVGGERMAPEQKRVLGEGLLAKVDLTALRARVTDWMAQGRRSLLVVRAPPDHAPSEENLRTLADRIATQKLEPMQDQGSRALIATLPEPGRIVETRSLPALDAQVWRLQNGATVVFKRARRGSNEARLRALSPGGMAHAAPSQYANALLAEFVVRDSGVGGHDLAALFRLLEGSKVSVAPWLNNNFEGIRGTSTAEELELMLQLVHLYVARPRVDAQALERYRTSLRAPPESSGAFARAITEALYPGNPLLAKPDPEKLDTEGMLRFYRDRFGNVGDFTFVMVADAVESQVRPLVERYLGGLSGGPGEDRLAPLLNQRQPGMTRVRVPGRANRASAVRIEFRGSAVSHAQERVALDALAAYLETRLHEELRGERGAVYVATVAAGWALEGYELTIAFDCLPTEVAALQAVVLQVIDQLARGDVSDSAVREVSSRLRARYVAEMTTTEFWADRLADAYTFGTPPEDLLTLPELTTRITRRSLADAARRYLRTDEYLDAVWSPE